MTKNRIPRRNLSERDSIVARVAQQRAETTYCDNIAYSRALELAGGPSDFDGFWTRSLEHRQWLQQHDAWVTYRPNVVRGMVRDLVTI